MRKNLRLTKRIFQFLFIVLCVPFDMTIEEDLKKKREIGRAKERKRQKNGTIHMSNEKKNDVLKCKPVYDCNKQLPGIFIVNL